MRSNSIKVAYGSTNLPLNIGGTKIACFILDDMKHVFPINGVQNLFGYEGRSEIWLLKILQNIAKLTIIPKELLTAFEDPFGIEISAYDGNLTHTKGIDSIVFIKTCETFIDAKNNGLLGANVIKISKIAEQILNNADYQSINEMIATATGYNTFKDVVKLQLQKYMQTQLKDNAALWLKTIPDHFYNVLFAIHNEDWSKTKAQPHIIGKLLYDIIFSRISAPLLQDLNTNKPKRNYKRKNNLIQNNEHPELKKHIEDILSLLKTSGNNWFIFMQLLNRTFQIQDHYDSRLRFESSSPKNEPLSVFNSSLKKLT